MIVKIPTSAMQKSEEDLITAVDEYCNENLLRRLNDGREGGANEEPLAEQTSQYSEKPSKPQWARTMPNSKSGWRNSIQSAVR